MITSSSFPLPPSFSTLAEFLIIDDTEEFTPSETKMILDVAKQLEEFQIKKF